MALYEHFGIHGSDLAYVADQPKGPKLQDPTNSPKPITSASEDAAWVKSIAEMGDQQALSRLFVKYGPRLKAWLINRGAEGSTAEDVVQDVMIKVWTKASSFNPEKASFSTWVYRITRNRWIDHKRKLSRIDLKEPDFMRRISDTEINSAEDDFILGEDVDYLRQELGKLKPNQREALSMAYIQHKTHQQISEETGIPLGTVKTRIRSGILALQHRMSKGSKS